MSDMPSNLRLEDLDLQGYTLSERVHGIALLQDPVRADILKFAASELGRLQDMVDFQTKETARACQEYRELNAKFTRAPSNAPKTRCDPCPHLESYTAGLAAAGAEINRLRAAAETLTDREIDEQYGKDDYAEIELRTASATAALREGTGDVWGDLAEARRYIECDPIAEERGVLQRFDAAVAELRRSSMKTSADETGCSGWVACSEQMPPHGWKVIGFYRNELGKGRTAMVHYTEKFKEVATGFEWDDTPDDWFDMDESGTSYVPEGWFEEAQTQENFAQLRETFTHWRHLPPQPEQVKPNPPQCIYRSGCKRSETCQKEGRCVPGEPE